MNIINTELVTLVQARARMIAEAVQADKVSYVMRLLAEMNAADVADIFNNLAPEVREQLVEQAIKSLDPEFLLDLDEGVRNQLFSKITTVGLADALSHMGTKDAISLIEDMTVEQQKTLLGSLNPTAKLLIETGLSYPESSIGRLVDVSPAVPATWTVRKTQALLGGWKFSSNPSYIILLDKNSKPESMLHIARFAAHTNGDTVLDALKTEELFKMTYDTDQEDAAFAFRRYKLDCAVVIDDTGKLLGTLSPESLLQVEHEEAEEDLMRITGTEGLDSGVSLLSVVASRARWLIPTIIFTSMSSMVIESFAYLIKVDASLVVISSMLAAIGGAGLGQAVGSTVRMISNRQLSIVNLGKAIRRELLICMGNGVIMAVILFARYVVIGGGNRVVNTLCITSGASFLVMLWASIIGVLVPFLTSRIGLDPLTSVGSALPATADIIANLSIFYLARHFLSQ